MCVSMWGGKRERMSKNIKIEKCKQGTNQAEDQHQMSSPFPHKGTPPHTQQRHVRANVNRQSMW